MHLFISPTHVISLYGIFGRKVKSRLPRVDLKSTQIAAKNEARSSGLRACRKAALRACCTPGTRLFVGHVRALCCRRYEWRCGRRSGVLPSYNPTHWRAPHAVLPSESGSLFPVFRSHQQDATERTGEAQLHRASLGASETYKVTT